MNRAEKIELILCRFIAMAVLCPLLIAFAFSGTALAVDQKYVTQKQWSDIRAGYKYTIEGSLFYDYLEPNKDYGVWGGANVGFSARVLPNVTLFTGLTGMSRSGGDLDSGGDGLLGTVGATVNWHQLFSSTTSLSFGSNIYYLPIFRVDQSFSIGMPIPSSWFGISINPGLFFASYHDDYRVYGLYVGPTFYIHRWFGGYSIVRSETRPGDSVAYSHVIFVGYGVAGFHNTTISTTIGDYSYFNNVADTSYEIREDTFNVAINHRHWVWMNWGLFGELRYFDLTNVYTGFGGTVGMFYEF